MVVEDYLPVEVPDNTDLTGARYFASIYQWFAENSTAEMTLDTSHRTTIHIDHDNYSLTFVYRSEEDRCILNFGRYTIDQNRIKYTKTDVEKVFNRSEYIDIYVDESEAKLHFRQE